MFPAAAGKDTLLRVAARVCRCLTTPFVSASFPRAVTQALVLAFLLICVVCPRADSSIGVVLNESLHESMDRITGTGHAAVYFSNICPDSPIRLRLCRSGELGSVISTYVNIGEDEQFGWNIVSLSVYLYGVEDPQNRPLFGSVKIKHLLEERYRDNYLSEYCKTIACQTSFKAEWRELVAATLIRGVYIFAVDSTDEQDRSIIAEFNAAANENHFNGVTRNCADFVKQTINTYFPHAVRRDFLNDFGMTSPKAVARTFSHFALRHPDAHFHVMHFAQAPGTIQRSSEVRAGTEQLFRSKKWLFPMLIFAHYELPFAATSYLLTGRFNPGKTFEKYPVADLTGPQIAMYGEARMRIVGAPGEWKEFRKELSSLAEESGIEFDGREMSRYFKHLDAEGTPSLDSDGSVWITTWENGEPMIIGASANNALSKGTCPSISYKFLLARASRVLSSPKHSRETMLEFRRDWNDLERASAELNAIAARSTLPAKGSSGGPTYGAAKD